MQVVGEAADGQSAVNQLRVLAGSNAMPNVVLMDLVMPKQDGIDATATIKREHPDIEVIVLTSFGEAERVQSALEAGAAGYLLKDAEADDIAKAIRAALVGELHLDPGVARQLTRSLMAPRDSEDVLSTREREVITLVGQGMSNKEIAESLVISERTARSHVSSILLKLGLSSRTQAALWAIREGISPI